jgi:hypothetical protein
LDGNTPAYLIAGIGGPIAGEQFVEARIPIDMDDAMELL